MKCRLGRDPWAAISSAPWPRATALAAACRGSVASCGASGPLTRWRRPLPAAERRQRGERWHLSDGRASASHAAPPVRTRYNVGKTYLLFQEFYGHAGVENRGRNFGPAPWLARALDVPPACPTRRPGTACLGTARLGTACHRPAPRTRLAAPRRAWPRPPWSGRCAHPAAEGLACPDTSRSLRPPRPKRAHADGVSRLYRWSCAPRTTSDTTYGPTSTSRSASRCGTGSSAPGLLPREGASSTRRPLHCTLPCAHACRNCRPPRRSVTRGGQRS